jgi:transcriptional regulator with XRE-family HTH domain
MTTANQAASFGSLLRAWRKARHLSQARLADDAEVSTRHLSFLETGRAAPSREMVLVLASALELPLRERNVLLGAAGFAAVYRESALESPEMEGVRRAVDFVLAKQEPYGAVVLDRLWNVRRMNQGAAKMFAFWLADAELPPEVMGNVLRLCFHPGALRRYMVDWEPLAATLIARLQREAVDDPRLGELLGDVLATPGLPRRLTIVDPTTPREVLMPVHLRRGDVEVRLFTMLSSIGTPLDVTAAELRIESYFPADNATERWIRALPG